MAQDADDVIGSVTLTSSATGSKYVEPEQLRRVDEQQDRARAATLRGSRRATDGLRSRPRLGR